MALHWYGQSRSTSGRASKRPWKPSHRAPSTISVVWSVTTFELGIARPSPGQRPSRRCRERRPEPRAAAHDVERGFGLGLGLSHDCPPGTSANGAPWSPCRGRERAKRVSLAGCVPLAITMVQRNKNCAPHKLIVDATKVRGNHPLASVGKPPVGTVSALLRRIAGDVLGHPGRGCSDGARLFGERRELRPHEFGLQRQDLLCVPLR